MNDNLNAALFRECVGQEFLLDAADGRRLVLRDVQDLAGDTPREDKQPFSLTFLDPDATVADAMPQQTHALRHASLGELHIFLVCLGPDLKNTGNTLIYEAIFT
jgi:hypothetical protein